MLKIVSALNGSSVHQSLTILGIELQLQLKKILFLKKIKKNKNIFGWFFLVIFRVTKPMEDNLQNIFFFKKIEKKYYFFFGKKIIFWLKLFFWSSSVEDDLWKTTWLIIWLPCTFLMLVLAQYNFYFYSSKL